MPSSLAYDFFDVTALTEENGTRWPIMFFCFSWGYLGSIRFCQSPGPSEQFCPPPGSAHYRIPPSPPPNPHISLSCDTLMSSPGIWDVDSYSLTPHETAWPTAISLVSWLLHNQDSIFLKVAQNHCMGSLLGYP